MTNNVVTLVVPVFNEARTIPKFIDAVDLELGSISTDLEIVFVDDGSTDETPEILRRICLARPGWRSVSFTRNFGKEAAIMAGLRASRGRAVVPVDVDLQDPLEVVLKMLKEFENGAEVVLAKRSKKLYTDFFRVAFSRIFRRVFGVFSAKHVNQISADFRLMSREVVNHIVAFPESQLYMKGLMDWVGFRHAVVEYDRGRGVGRPSKFTFNSLVGLGVAGILDFSPAPLRFLTVFGVTVCGGSFIFGSYVVLSTIIMGNDVPGFTTLLASTLFLGGANLAAAGLLGEYVARILIEAKRRPPYLVKAVSEMPTPEPDQ